MTRRRLAAGLLVAMWLGAAGMIVVLVATWPPDLPWELVRSALIALWLAWLTGTSRTVLRQAQPRGDGRRE